MASNLVMSATPTRPIIFWLGVFLVASDTDVVVVVDEAAFALKASKLADGDGPGLSAKTIPV